MDTRRDYPRAATLVLICVLLMSTSTFTFVVEAVSGPTTYYSRASGGAAMTAVAFPAADLSDRCVRVPTDRQVPEQQVRSGELLLSSVEQMGRAEHILS
ncbi:MAG TPA: hypothetical protein PKJ77_05805, partial [Thermodesulfobacteriota bacterium]|nr:hypothetical protein [Thermodesulfobacteriota bacterium]